MLSGLEIGDDGLYVMPGLTLASGDGFMLGFELGVVHFDEDLWDDFGVDTIGWYGGYVDGVYDCGSSSGRASLGLGAGALLFGLEFGGVVQTTDSDSSLGVTGRVLLTFAYFHLYVRASYFPARDRGDALVPEVGVLLKLPELIDRDE